MAAGDDDSDEELMERYRDGDAAAFDGLYRRHKGGVFRYLLRQCGERAVAEELFQDVWMNLIRARASYAVEARFSTYLYRIAHNRLIDHYRARAGGVPLSFDAEDGPDIDALPAPRGDDPMVAADLREQAARLLAAIALLPEAQREAFLLQQESGMSVEEIAQATGVNRETAKSRLRYALGRLRAQLAGGKA
jgi:RNA polymerase sigma-70 factor (ECF subfamily)